MPRKKKEEHKPDISPTVIELPLEEVLADRFNRYSKYIIQERALPDARDGLKPVQRRILWAMWETGNTYNKPYHKSAKTVGNVIGNYHPHGESSVYDAIVRMSQEWKIRTPLIDMQGNNGSIDDDPPAAMRYTEARLGHIADYMLEDIDKETVDWAPNFSDETVEPVVLPARYPNLLVNGITGIAAGYATNIPPHNLNEVLDACIYRIDHPDCSLEDLMQFVQGPDFPTGGIVMGMDGVRQALATGRGKCFIRSRTEVVSSRTIQQIIVHEIPYEVVKSSLVKRIDDLRLNHTIDGLMDVRDESDRNGLRIVLDLKKEANAQAILNYLYKHTDLQISYTYNVTAIVNRTPVLMGLPAILDAFLAHRDDIVIKRSKHELAGKKKRAHILEGLIQAVSVLDEVIALIRSSRNKAESKSRLIDRFHFTELQAEAILSLQLYRLSNTDIQELQDEAAGLRKDIVRLEKILEVPKVRHALIKQELHEMNQTFHVERMTTLQEEAEEIVIDQRAMVADEQVVLTVSRDGYVKKVSMRSYGAAKESPTAQKEGDTIVGISACSTLDTLLFITDKGKYGEIPVFRIAEGRWKDIGSHISSYVRTDPQEKITAVWLYREKPSQVQLVLASRQGMIKRIAIEDLPHFRGKSVQVMNLGNEDLLQSAAAVQNPDDTLILASRKGNGVRYPVLQIPQSGPKTKGVKALNLKDDTLQCLERDTEEWILIQTADLQIKRTAAQEIPVMNRPAKGVSLYRKIKSRPVDLKTLQPVPLKEPVQISDEKVHDFLPASLPKKDLKAGCSVLQTESYTFVPDIPRLESGIFDGTETSSETVRQISLFEEADHEE